MPDPSASAIRELARTILARGEYGLMNENPAPEWLDWLRRFIAWMGVMRVNSPALFWAVVVAMAITVAAAIAQIVWSLRAALRAQAPPHRPFSAGEPPDFFAEARQLAASGRFLEAGHRLMIASFGLLAQRSIIELRPDRSNRWIRKALCDSALAEAWASEIGALVERTERRWFGNRESEPDIYLDWLSVYQRLLSWGE